MDAEAYLHHLKAGRLFEADLRARPVGGARHAERLALAVEIRSSATARGCLGSRRRGSDIILPSPAASPEGSTSNDAEVPSK